MSNSKNQVFHTELQAISDETCGPMCLVNGLNHFGITKTINEVLLGLNISRDDQTYLSQLALYLQQHHPHLDILFLSDNPFVTPDGLGSTPEEITKNLRQRLDRYKKDLKKGQKYLEIDNLPDTKFVLSYLESSGRLHCGTISPKVIDSLLSRGYLIVAVCTNIKLWGKVKVLRKKIFDPVEGNAEGHAIIIYGQKENTYLVSDPYPTGIPHREKNYVIAKDDLIAALYWSLQLLAFKNKSSKKS